MRFLRLHASISYCICLSRHSGVAPGGPPAGVAAVGLATREAESQPGGRHPLPPGAI